MGKLQNFVKKYPIPCVIIVSLVFIAVILVVTVLSIKPTERVEVCVAPESATVTIDGKEYKNGTYNLPRGTLTVKISKEGFSSKEYTFDSTKSDKLYDYIMQSDGGNSWYVGRPEDAMLLTKIGDFLADTTADNYALKYPVTKILPLIVAEYDVNDEYVEYRIDGGNFSDCEQDFCLKVTDTTGGNLEAAKDYLRAQGYNPSDFEVLYEYTPIIPLE